ncbi:MAG: amidohydrolase, partial [Chloroflexi bacterium]|nr:amidohydrolase [Chloroflexota bacterium]
LRAGALAVGGSVTVRTLPGYLPLRQHPGLTDLFAANARKLVGEENVVRGEHGGGSTDVGDISHLLPTIQPYVGGAKGVGHTEHYLIEDYGLAVLKAAKAMTATVIDLLTAGAAGAQRVLSGYRPAMIRSDYLAYLRAMQTERTYSE